MAVGRGAAIAVRHRDLTRVDARCPAAGSWPDRGRIVADNRCQLGCESARQSTTRHPGVGSGRHPARLDLAGEIAEQLDAMGGQDALGMKLHALDQVGGVAERHDVPVVV